MYCIPLEIKANCSQKAIKRVKGQNILIKSIIATYLSTVGWMDPVVLILIYRGTLMARTIAFKVVLIHHEIPFILFEFKYKPKEAVSHENNNSLCSLV